MARTKTQLLLRRLKRTPWKKGRLKLGKYRLDLHPNNRWYLCINAMPKVGGRFNSIPGGKKAAERALRKMIQQSFATT